MTKNERWVFFNEIFCLASQAFVPLEDRGFLFGEGVFTTVCVDNGKAQLLPLHFQRLINQTAELKIPWKKIEESTVAKLILLNQAQKGCWRLKIIVTSHTLLLTLQPYFRCAQPFTLALYPFPIERPLAHLKTLAYLDLIRVQQFGQLQGKTDAVITNCQGTILETGCCNLFWIYKEEVYFPDFHLPYLKGVFLQALLKTKNFPIHLIQWRLIDVPQEAFWYSCNALNHVRAVNQLEGENLLRNKEWEKRLDELTIEALQMNS